MIDFGSIVLSAALLIAVGVAIARPILERAAARERRPTGLENLAAERESVLAALRELDFDHATGKVADEDYTPQRAALVAQGVALLQQLDALNAQPAASSADDEIETAVRAARARLARPAAACPHCGHTRQAGDRFCAKCGAALAAEGA